MKYDNQVRILALFLAGGFTVASLVLAQDQAKRYTRAEMEQFLLNAEIVSSKELGEGVTNSRKAKLSDGHIEHSAHIQTIDVAKASFATKHGTELNFKDSYKFNIAAYRLDKIMDLNMVPVSVERKVGGKTAAVTWWVDDTWMTEQDRVKQSLEPPNSLDWNKQMYVVRVFDQLIFNTDRNLGNLVIDKKWNAWMIDHTRAFRTTEKLPALNTLPQCERKLLTAMRKLDQDTLEQELRPFATKTEIKALLGRRDQIVKYFEDQIAAKTEAAILYDLPLR